jgi:tRNA U34 5-carboxymethylaminomethyl modifying GTPase MnmE/TrmE
VARAKQEIVAADLVVFVSDLTARWDAELYRQVAERRSATVIARPAIIVHNKCDLVEMVMGDRPSGIQTSAVTGTGVPDLAAAIANCLVPTPLPLGSAIPFLNKHIDRLHGAFDAVYASDMSTARHLLMTIGH